MSDIYSDLYLSTYSSEYIPKTKVKSVFAFHIAGKNYVEDLTNFSLESKPLDPERVTFGKYTAGRAVEWTLKVGAVFDGGAEGSLHDLLWNYSGYTTDFIIRPFSDFDPLTKRYYQGLIRIPYKPDIRVKAGEESQWDYEFKVIGHPTRSDKAMGILIGTIIDEF